MDGTYVLSGSDDMNVRCWKADASAQLGTLLPREKRKKQYQAALKERFKHMPEIKRIRRHHHVPKAIHKAQKLRRTMTASETRKRRTGWSTPRRGRRRRSSSPRGRTGSSRRWSNARRASSTGRRPSFGYVARSSHARATLQSATLAPSLPLVTLA